jgi:protein-disulfide isomerase
VIAGWPLRRELFIVKLSKSILTAIVVLLVVVGVVAIKAVVFYKQFKQPPRTLELAQRTKGDPQAKIKITEYTDFQCPACAKASEVVDEVLKKHPGKIYFEHKYFPLSAHFFSRKASVYAECAAEQGKFWPFHDVLFRSQASWVKMNTVDDYFSQLAVSLGIDGLRLSVCVNNPLVMARIDKDVKEGKDIGVSSTPTFFVNGKMTVGGNNFKKAVEEILGANAK